MLAISSSTFSACLAACPRPVRPDSSSRESKSRSLSGPASAGSLPGPGDGSGVIAGLLGMAGAAEENLGAATVELSAAEIVEIDEAASRIHLEGERYPEALERLTGR